MSNIFRELRNYRRFYKKTDKSRRDVVFYAEDAASWRYYEGLIEQLIDKENIPVCYITSDPKDPVLNKKAHENFTVFYIKSLLPLFILYLDSKLLLMTMPDLDKFHIKRSKNGAHHIYLFHNIGSSFPVIRFGALFNYDTIFCVGPHHIEEIRKQEELYNLKKKQLVEFGYYAVEKVYEQYKKHKPVEEDKKRVLIGPSWGDNSILNYCGRELISVLLDSGFQVIVRPHPMTRKHTPEILKNLIKEFGTHDNFISTEDISSIEAIYNSDILISDWSGFTYEYAFGTEMPVLFIDVPRKIVNNKENELGIEPIDIGIRNELGEVVSTNNLEEAPGLINRMITEKEKYRESIVDARSRYVYNFGSSSEAGAEFINNFIRGTG